MASARACYCKHEEGVSRGRENDVGMYNRVIRRPVTVVSKKSATRSETTRGSSGESRRRGRSVADERASNASRSVETQPPDLVLSPETSTALENAERMIHNAKRQLMEVCGTSTLDSACRDRNTYSDDPPLDDETEELLYIRELVASRFQEANRYPRPEADGEGRSAGPRQFPSAARIPARRVDLSAPKFHMTQRRRGIDYLEHERRRRGRVGASPRSAGVPSSWDEGVRAGAPYDDDTVRVIHVSSGGPTVRDDSPPKTRQREDRARKMRRANASDAEDGEPGKSREGEERVKPITVEAETTARSGEARADVQDAAVSADLEPRVRDRVRGKETASRDPEEGGALGGTEGDDDGEEIVVDSDENAGLAEADGGGTPRERRNDADVVPRSRAAVEERSVANERRPVSRGERAPEPPPAEETASRETNLPPRREDVTASRRPIGEEDPSEIDESLYRSPADPRAAEPTLEVELYRPRLDDLDSMLLSNDEKLERIVRAAREFAELLRKPKFAEYKGRRRRRSGRRPDEEEGRGRSGPRTRRREQPPRGRSPASVDELAAGRASLAEDEAECKDDGLVVAPVVATETTTTTASSTARQLGRRETPSRSSTRTGSGPYPASEYASDDDEGEDEDGARRSTTDGTARASESESVVSDVAATFFRDLPPPALSSTRADAVEPRGREASRSRRNARRGLTRGSRNATADRVVACVLRNERRSAEGRARCAPTATAIAPATARKFLERLREIEPGGHALRRTETLDILKSILVDIGRADGGGAVDVNARNVGDVGRIEGTRDREHRECRGKSASTRSARATDEDGESSGRRTEGASAPENVPINVEDRIDPVGEARDDGEEIRPRDPVRDSAAADAPPIVAVERSPNFPERRGSVEFSAARPGSVARPENPGGENGERTGGNSRRALAEEDDESLRQISDIRGDRSSRISELEAKSEEARGVRAPEADSDPKAIAPKYEEDIASERLIAAKEEGTEVASRGTRDDDDRPGDVNVSSSLSGAGEAKEDERERPDASTGGSKQSDAATATTNGPDSSPRDRVLSRAVSKSGESSPSLKGIESRGKAMSESDAASEPAWSPTKARGDDEVRSSAAIVTGKRADGNEVSGPLGGAENDDERSRAVASASGQKSPSTSSHSNTVLNRRNSRFNGDTSSVNGRRIVTSSEASHSEGELYMPSSCSYSLGEVRVLDKCDLIADSTLDNSVTVLVTRSMLASLNDSSTSLLASSGCI